MGLADLTILPIYNSKVNDVLQEFYVPALSNAQTYKRVSAFFDSNIVSLYSKGIENIVKNNGHIYFIFSNILSREDYALIKNSYYERENYFKRKSEELDVEEPSDNLRNLGYLIVHGYVDIKIAITNGISHDKFGLIEDETDTICFRGSNNETVASLSKNVESFETSCTWKKNAEDSKKIIYNKNLFQTMWNNKMDDVLVLDVPDVIKQKLIKFAGDELTYIESDYPENSAILDYDDGLTIRNNLTKKFLLSQDTMFYKDYMENKVDSDFTIRNLYFKFRPELTFKYIKKFISDLDEYATNYNFNVVQSADLLNYISEYELNLDKRRNLGIKIKEKDVIFSDDFEQFKKVLEQNMVRKLRYPQLWDAYHIVRMKRAANFSVPGSGKTSIVYGAFAYLKAKGEVNKIVMIGPINSFKSWKEELVLCFGENSGLTIYDYQREKSGNSATKFYSIHSKARTRNLILFNYESINNNLDVIKDLVDENTLLVFDEVHRIKAIDGVRASAALQIGTKAKYRVVLTGTPLPNGYGDLYNILNILFTDEYEDFFGYDSRALVNAKNDFLLKDDINSRVYPFFCRTNKKDLEVPPPEPDILVDNLIEPTDVEKEMFELIYRTYRHNFLVLYIRLIQASCNPKLVLRRLTNSDIKIFNTEEDDTDFSDNVFDYESELSDSERELIQSIGMTKKFERGIELVADLVSNGKVIVWGIFVDTLKTIKQRLAEKGIQSEVITGEVPLDQREQIIDRFKNDDSLKVLITNPHTLGESVSLHKNCHQAVYFEYSFNLVHMLQSRDRIHRLGLEESQKTYYYYLAYEECGLYSPIDFKVYNSLLKKEQRQQELVENKDIEYVEDDVKQDIDDLFKDFK